MKDGKPTAGGVFIEQLLDVSSYWRGKLLESMKKKGDHF